MYYDMFKYTYDTLLADVSTLNVLNYVTAT